MSLRWKRAPRGRGAKEFVQGHTAGPAHAKPCALLGPPLVPAPGRARVHDSGKRTRSRKTTDGFLLSDSFKRKPRVRSLMD